MVWISVGIVLGFVALFGGAAAYRLYSVSQTPAVGINSSHERDDGVLDATADDERLVVFLRIVKHRRGTVLLDAVELVSDVELTPTEDSTAIEFAGTTTAADGTERYQYTYERPDTELGGPYHAFDMHFQPHAEPFELTVRARPDIPAKDLLVPWHADRFAVAPAERTFQVRPG
jgi:hypothetical protein